MVCANYEDAEISTVYSMHANQLRIEHYCYVTVMNVISMPIHIMITNIIL